MDEFVLQQPLDVEDWHKALPYKLKLAKLFIYKTGQARD